MAHDTEKLRELLERVEKATGPDMELDHDIASAFGEVSRAWIGHGKPFGSAFPDYSYSLNTALSLAGKVLVFDRWDLMVGGRDKGHTCMATFGRHIGSGATPPLAVLDALLLGLLIQAEEEGEDE